MKKIASPLGGFLLIIAALCVMSCNKTPKPDYKAYYNGIVKELSSDKYMGRSVHGNGDVMAGRYIVECLQQIKDIVPCEVVDDEQVGIKPFLKSEIFPCDCGRWEEDSPWIQNFQMPMNVMTGDMALSVDGVPFKATVDFVAKEFSPTCHGEFEVATLDYEFYTPDKFVEHLNSGKYSDKFVVIDWNHYLETLKPHPFDKYLPYMMPLDKVGGLICKQEEQFPYFKARTYYTTPMPVLFVNSSFPDDAKKVRVDIDSEMMPTRDAHNVIAWLPGKDASCDEYYTFIAHYDHLGLMGAENVFPGANDNASGVAMLLALASYFSENRPDKGIQFIFLDAEETNLLGAFFYCENPRLPLEKCKYLINLDMIADTGDHLATEVSEEGEAGMERFRQINADGKFPPIDIAMQELSDNSDHYAFALKHVPCCYFSTEGDLYQYYHTPRDNFENTSDENFDRIFHMVTEFVNE